MTSADAFTRLAVGGGAIGFDYIALSDHIVEPLAISMRGIRIPKLASSQGQHHHHRGQKPDARGLDREMGHGRQLLVARIGRPCSRQSYFPPIDVMSGARVIVGAGWLKEEFEALGAPPFDERGKVTDEYFQRHPVHCRLL